MNPIRSVLIIILVIILAVACSPQVTPVSMDTPVPPTVMTPSGIKMNALPGIKTDLEDRGKNHELTGAVLIAYQGEILLSQGYGLADRVQEIPNTAQTRFRVGAFTQQFTAAAILLLSDQVKLALEDLICTYLEDCPSAWQEITLHHLLAWRAGIPDYGNEESESDYGVMTAEQFATYFHDSPLDYPPGEKWTWYPTPNYVLLSHVIERVSGETYEDYIQDHIFAALGMENSGFDVTPSGLALGYSSSLLKEPVELPVWSNGNLSTTLYSTVEDLYLFDQALMSGKLMPKELSDLMFTQYSTSTDITGLMFGYGWWIREDGGRVDAMALSVLEGYQGFNQLYPQEQIAIIVLGNQGDKSVEQVGRFIDEWLVVKE